MGSWKSGIFLTCWSIFHLPVREHCRADRGAWSASAATVFDLVVASGISARGTSDGRCRTLSANRQPAIAQRRSIDLPDRTTPTRPDCPHLRATGAWLSSTGTRRHPDDHDRSRHGYRTISGLPTGTASAASNWPELALLRRSTQGHVTSCTRTRSRHFFAQEY